MHVSSEVCVVKSLFVCDHFVLDQILRFEVVSEFTLIDSLEKLLEHIWIMNCNVNADIKCIWVVIKQSVFAIVQRIHSAVLLQLLRKQDGLVFKTLAQHHFKRIGLHVINIQFRVEPRCDLQLLANCKVLMVL